MLPDIIQIIQSWYYTIIYEMQKREAYRVDIVSERQAAIPGVLELAGNIGGP